jgi:hypothetical protein
MLAERNPDVAAWLRRHIPTAGGGVMAEGHLTLAVERIGDVHAWLLDRLA